MKRSSRLEVLGKKGVLKNFAKLKFLRTPSSTEHLRRLFLYEWKFVNLNLTFYVQYALVIARFRVQYDQYFPSFSYFPDLFHEPLGELDAFFKKFSLISIFVSIIFTIMFWCLSIFFCWMLSYFSHSFSFSLRISIRSWCRFESGLSRFFPLSSTYRLKESLLFKKCITLNWT